MALQNIRQKSAAAAAVILGLGALLVGCSADTRNAASASLGGTGAPALAVSCEPNQRAIVRQVAVNGGLQPQVQCESVLAPAATTPRRVVYQRAPERIVARPKRSVQKSAIIIGSSAGVGAGIGAAVGGKKGAGIGALIGGGGAALWDQITRHRQ